MEMFDNNGYKLPTEPNELILKTLTDKRISDSYIIFNEQQKVFARPKYLKEFEWWVLNTN